MRKKALWYLLSLLMLFTGLAILGMAIIARPSSKNNSLIKTENIGMRNSKASYDSKLKGLTVKKLNQKVENQKLDLGTVKKQTTSTINKAMTEAYSVQSAQDYRKLQIALPKLVGDSMASKLIELNKSSVSQSGKITYPYEKADNVAISFGKYQYSELPVIIFVNYHGPKINTTASGNKQATSYQVSTGQAMFTATVNTSNNQISLDSYKTGVTVNKDVK